MNAELVASFSNRFNDLLHYFSMPAIQTQHHARAINKTLSTADYLRGFTITPDCRRIRLTAAFNVPTVIHGGGHQS